ncbi:MAG: hypothetical protein K6E78_08435 [Treponema sp.]|nr:hypothetical protein [Treponema sp.]
MTNDFYQQVTPLMDFAFLQRKWFETHFKALSKKYGISLTELSVCLILHMNSKVQSARDVEKYTELKRGIISVCVEHLSCKKFLRQEPVENDRRMKKLVLAQKAYPMLEEASVIIQNYIESVFCSVKKEEMEICCRVFEQMKDELIKLSESGSKKSDFFTSPVRENADFAEGRQVENTESEDSVGSEAIETEESGETV